MHAFPSGSGFSLLMAIKPWVSFGRAAARRAARAICVGFCVRKRRSFDGILEVFRKTATHLWRKSTAKCRRRMVRRCPFLCRRRLSRERKVTQHSEETRKRKTCAASERRFRPAIKKGITKRNAAKRRRPSLPPAFAAQNPPPSSLAPAGAVQASNRPQGGS